MSFDRNAPQAAELRQRAEERLRERAGTASPKADPPSAAEAEARAHELEVHQIELEMQNEDLLRAQEDLEALRERYFDLYDLAPLAYLSLSEKGLILEANLAAATLLGLERSALVSRVFSLSIATDEGSTSASRR